MRSWLKSFEYQTRGAVLGIIGTLVLVGAVTASSKLTGGSLPLKGDELASGNGADPNGYATGSGSHWNVLNWAPGVQANTPSSFSKNYVDASGRTAQQIFVSSGANPDVGTAASVENMSVSDDSGKTFLITQHNYPAQSLNMVRMPDGSLLTIDFIPEWRNAEHTQVNLLVRTSPDGKSWTLHQAPLTVPDDHLLGPTTNGLRVNKRPIVLADGTLMVPAYTVFRGTSRQTSIVLQSTDRGASWTLRSIIPAASTPGTNEVGWAYTTDGRLTAVMRTVDSPVTNLVQSFSTDDGRTWSEAQPTVGPDGKEVQGILPDLLLLPNGTMLLLTGRPDVRMLVSYDGTARRWDTQTTIFANYPSTGNNGRFDGSSANNSMESVAANRSVVFYDQCAAWGCGAYDEQFGVSAEYVSALTPGAGRIDIMSKLLDGTAAVTGTFAKPNKAFPEQRPEGAFDGSSLAGADIVLSATHGEQPQLTLKLDHAYDINRIGLMLGHGVPQSATVQLSGDGVHWSAPVVSAADTEDRAMRYTDFPTQTAQYVRVAGPVGATTTVTELEVYSAVVDTFENEIAFAVPRGWTNATHAWVTDVPNNPAYADFGGYHSSTALRLFDKWTDDNARITRPFSARDHASVSMQWGYQDARAEFAIGLDSGSDTPWKFDIVAGKTATTPQSVRVFDGSTWTTLGTLSALVPARTYVPLSIDATATSATLTVNGQAFTTGIKAATATSYDGMTVTTGDPAQYGGFYMLDDVAVA